MFVGRVWGGQYREELILNVTVLVVRVWGGEYREEPILNDTVQPFYYQLMHIMLKNRELLKHSKII